MPNREIPNFPKRIGEAAVSLNTSSLADLKPLMSNTFVFPVPRMVIYFRFLEANVSPIPLLPAAKCPSIIALEKRTPFSAAGPITAVEPLPFRSE